MLTTVRLARVLLLAALLAALLAGCDSEPLPSPARACDLAPPAGNVAFEWEPCPGEPSGFAACRYIDKATGRTICVDSNHMPAHGVQCVAVCS